ncbi:MAG: GreA/GreB family elongation factor [Paludibacter sp.]
MVPPRANLPDGVTNYVTPNGMQELLAEQQQLIYEKDHPYTTNENERRIASNFINAKLTLLNQRIGSAKVISPEEQPQHEVRFGAKVSLKSLSDGRVQVFQIVGVDEASITKGKLSCLSPGFC